MKYSIFQLFLLISTVSFSQTDYTININGEEMDVELGKSYQINSKSKNIEFTVSAKDTLTFKNDFFTFQYPKEFHISKITIDGGIDQMLLMSAEGTGIMFQTYSTMSPVLMNEIMMNEMTKESVDYGYKLERKDYKRTLTSGKVFDVDKAVLTYQDELNAYEIMSFGKKDSGVLLMVLQMAKDLSPETQKLISLMWESLEIY